MKTFVVLLVLVAISVWADDIVWESGQLQEFMPAPESNITEPANGDVKTQDTQEQSKETPPFTEQSRANPSHVQPQTVDQSKEEELKVGREANEIAQKENALTNEGNRIQRWLVVIGGITIGTQVLLTLVQLHFIRKANKHAADAAKAAKDSVGVARDEMKIANRAYLFVTDWQAVDFRASGQTIVTFRLYNAGHTPATLEKMRTWYGIMPEKSPPLTPLCLRDERKSEGLVNPQGAIMGKFGPFSIETAIYKALEARSLFLYVAVCFVYRDVFDHKYWVVSSGVYNVEDRTFTMLDNPGYNCSKDYDEKEWGVLNL